MGLELGWFFEQIQFLLGHASVLTTERYLGCKQNLGHPVNDLFDLKTNVLALEDSPSSATAQATPVKPLLAEQVGRRQDNGDAFRRPAPETVREEEPHRVRLDEPPGGTELHGILSASPGYQ